VNEFIDECRREWRRLGVPDAVANEMAADLTADLDEAAAEGGTPEDVLGNSAFDPRRFASAWAVARGVTGPPSPDVPTRRRPPVAIVLAVLAAVLALGAGLIVAAGTRGHSFSVAVHSAVVPELKVTVPVARTGRLLAASVTSWLALAEAGVAEALKCTEASLTLNVAEAVEPTKFESPE